MSRVRNDLFDPTQGLDRGRGKFTEGVWYLLKWAFLISPLPWPSALRVGLLRLFGAEIGARVYIKPRVNVHFPWKLTVGDDAWIGEEVLILNFEPVVIGSHTCISQRAFICTGNHDFRDPGMRYRNAPITIGNGAWIGAQCFVGPGVTVGVDAVTTAGSIVVRDLPAGMICTGNPCVPLRQRWR
jgi:putative colanic acid biosynthesis acetyltransferase WcaF